MKKNILLLLVASVAAISAFADSFNTLIDKADKAVKAGDYTHAEQYYREAINQSAKNDQKARLLSNIALMQAYQGNDAGAIETYTEALALEPGNARMLRNRAASHMQLGNEGAAFADYTTLLATDSLDAEALFFHGSIAMNMGDTIAAKHSLLTLEKVEPRSTATHKALAAYYTKVKNLPEALRHYNLIIEIEPDAESYLGRAAVEFTMDMFDQASLDIAEAMRLSPDDGEAYLIRAGLNKRRYEFDAALADGKKAVSLGVDPRRVSRLLNVDPADLK